MAVNPKKSSNAEKPTGKSHPPLRYAHPFFGTGTALTRQPTTAGKRMLDHISGKLSSVPPAKSDAPMPLAAIIGDQSANEIQQSGQILFHCGGDSGVPDTLDRETRQVMVAEAMAQDYSPLDHTQSPAFLYHLGDVIYTKPGGTYESEFYVPYKHYPGKIVGIPGNHDGETDQKIKEFQDHFCADDQKVPPDAGAIFRETMNQPGVYWLLDAPFVQIVGLYSNCAENPGFISGPIPGNDQKTWLIDTLKTIVADRKAGRRRALLFATHHPPFSSGGHSGSTQMLADIDDACQQAGGIYPDAFLSGHAHSIQRYTRTLSVQGQQRQIPYLIYGCLGHGGQHVSTTFPVIQGDHRYEFGYAGYGYALVRVTQTQLILTAYGVDWDQNLNVKKTQLDTPVTVTLD